MFLNRIPITTIVLTDHSNQSQQRHSFGLTFSQGLAACAFIFLGFLMMVPTAKAAICSSSSLRVTYSSSSQKVEVKGCGDTVDLTTIKSVGALSDSVLQEESPGIWLLRAHLVSYEGVTLKFYGRSQGGDVDWLKLMSESGRFVTLKTYNGGMDFSHTKVTSWDTTSGNVDTAYSDGSGRAFVLARNNRNDVDETRMDVTDSEFAYLGYPGGEAYGVSWRTSENVYPQQTVTGEVHGSSFHHNYYGVYTFGAQSMVWQDNEFFSNIQYGFDPHDDSNGFLVERNISHHNGNHGFIVSKRCKNNIFRNNISYRNLHGFMLDRDSDNNLLENNEAYENTDGLAIYESSNNIIRNNRFHHNDKGVRINGRLTDHPSTGNRFENNTIDNNVKYGIYLYDQTKNNIIVQNTIHHQGSHGIYSKTPGHRIGGPGQGNDIYENVIGVNLYETGAQANVVEENMIHDNAAEGVKVQKGANNILRNNTINKNRNYGVRFVSAPSGIVEGNTIEANTNYGLYLDTASNLDVLSNTIRTNGNRQIYSKNSPNLEIRNNIFVNENTYGMYFTNADNALLESNAMTGPTTGAYYITTESTGMIIRNTDVVNLTFGDSLSNATLQDSRSYLWQNSRNLEVTAGTSQTSLPISKANASTLAATRIDLALIPGSSTISATVTAWDPSAGVRQWREKSSNSSLEVAHTILGLLPSGVYAVKVDGSTWQTFTADSQGEIGFTYDGGYASGGNNFELVLAP